MKHKHIGIINRKDRSVYNPVAIGGLSCNHRPSWQLPGGLELPNFQRDTIKCDLQKLLTSTKGVAASNLYVQPGDLLY